MSTTSTDGARRDDFDDLLPADHAEHTSFSVGFRGYDREEVDAAFAELTSKLQRLSAEVADLRAESAQARAASEAGSSETAQLAEELAAAQARAADAEPKPAALTAEFSAEGADGDQPPTRQQFEAVLRVAEEQANTLIQNTALQAERLLEAARDDVLAQRAELEADVVRITAQAQHDADQSRLKMETEYTAHEARIQREAAHAAGKVAQAEREAAAIRTEAEKGAAALRAMVTSETAQQRADAERDVRDIHQRVLEFEESLTRRQDDAQQEFLVLHNQAVAHAERITADANEQVASSLEHAQRISAKAEEFERLMRAQAAQIEADAKVRASETLERARVKAQKIVETVTSHTTAVLRDAEDRTRQLRWQQQQLNSFMAEVRELIRPDGPLSAVPELPADDADPAED
ncbi:DivIVA domain-containing protein [Microbacterium sediminis]|uniref:Cell division initiation protein n=1 Tax=Microbacterium sediminis TaxID=904291 RepID=A0A1B9N7V8_9MICO|nr:DivIVA domain-containing protein [Microbacterium sediminis]OCG72668.1 cell division initiation protein [Microbacterium sediminis]